MALKADIQDQGFTILHNPESPVAESIIFVHGLRGHPYRTWAYRSKAHVPSSSSSSKALEQKKNSWVRLFSPKWKKHEDDISAPSETVHRKEGSDSNDLGYEREDLAGSETYWLKDFLPQDVKDARILTYGYDSNITRGFAGTDQNGIFGHSRDLLYQYRNERQISLPVIFIVHSLGGIILKEALRRAELEEDTEVKDIFKSTAGIIFLGTPHRGSADLAGLADAVRRVASLVLRLDSNKPLLRSLGIDSPELELCRESFMKQWRQEQFKVKTFQEAYGMTGVNIGPANEKIVPDTSSSLDDPKEQRETIAANHMDMSKFAERDGQDYKKVLSEIKRMLKVAGDSRTESSQALLKSLWFPSMDDRKHEIYQSLENTCNWLFSHSIYIDWIQGEDLQDNRGLLWIKGKPGTGKSTLMKEVLRRYRETFKENEIVAAAFFFHGRGLNRLEKSPKGLFRSLLHQILDQDPKALHQITKRFWEEQKTKGHLRWYESEELMREILLEMFSFSPIQVSRPNILIVDALDECNRDDVFDLIEFFRNLAERAHKDTIQLKICISSRHYPHISIDKCPEIFVEKHNRKDISLYAHNRTKRDRKLTALAPEISSRSSGVFLWVVLVISTLNKMAARRSPSALKEEMTKLPTGLGDLFHTLFSSCMDPSDRQKLVLLVRLALFATDSLRASDLVFALDFGSTRPPESARDWMASYAYVDTYGDKDLRNDVDIIRDHERMIVELSCGLLEFNRGRFQFIHGSVRHFFLHETGGSLISSPDGESIVGTGNSAIASICATSLQILEIRSLQAKVIGSYGNMRQNFIHELRSAISRLPFLEYAGKYVLSHAETAEGHGISQKQTLSIIQGSSLAFLIGPFLYAKHRLGKESLTLYTLYEFLDPSLLCICILRDKVKCAKRLIEMGAGLEEKTTLRMCFCSRTGLDLSFRFLSPKLLGGYSRYSYERFWDELAISDNWDVQPIQVTIPTTSRLVAFDVGTEAIRHICTKFEDQPSAHGDKSLAQGGNIRKLFDDGVCYTKIFKEMPSTIAYPSAMQYFVFTNGLLQSTRRLHSWESGYALQYALEAVELISANDYPSGIISTQEPQVHKISKFMREGSNFETTPPSFTSMCSSDQISHRLMALCMIMERISCLSKHKAEVDVKDSDGMTLLHLAVSQKLGSLTACLVSHGANVGIASSHGDTALHIAITQCWIEGAEFLMENAIAENAEDAKRDTSPHIIAGRGHPQGLESLLPYEEYVDTQNANGDTALHIASTRGSVAVMECLLRHGANINIVNENGNTAVQEAVLHGNFPVAEYLLKNGATAEGRNTDEMTALHLAITETCHRLTNYWLKPHLKEELALRIYGEEFCLQRASEIRLKTILVLISASTHDLKDANGRTALHYAVSLPIADRSALAEAILTVNILVSARFDPKTPDSDGQTPRDLWLSRPDLDRFSDLRWEWSNDGDIVSLEEMRRALWGRLNPALLDDLRCLFPGQTVLKCLRHISEQWYRPERPPLESLPERIMPPDNDFLVYELSSSDASSEEPDTVSNEGYELK